MSKVQNGKLSNQEIVEEIVKYIDFCVEHHLTSKTHGHMLREQVATLQQGIRIG